jgi:hypothetical protein
VGAIRESPPLTPHLIARRMHKTVDRVGSQADHSVGLGSFVLPAFVYEDQVGQILASKAFLDEP